MHVAPVGGAAAVTGRWPQPSARRPAAAPGAIAPIGAAPPFGAVIFDLRSVVGGTAVEPWLVAGTVELVRRLDAGRVLVGLVGVGSDLDAVPGLGEMRELLDAVVTSAPAVGNDRVDSGTGENPSRAALAESARQLRVPPSRTAVVTTTAAGVRAARASGFGMVVGLDASGERAVLEAAGADIVLADIARLDLGVLRTDPWVLAYEGFDPAHEGHREALTTLGNGYVGVRGAAPEAAADGVHYPGTYLAGVYNRLTSTVQGRQVEDEHRVNTPNWLLLDLCLDDGGWWSTGGLTVRGERRELDLRRGLLTRHVQLVDKAGRGLEVTQRRLVSMQRPHLAALETTVEARGWSGQIGVRAGIDAGITNSNVAEYAGLARRHLDNAKVWEADPDTLVVEAVTTHSRITIATAARTTLGGVGDPPARRIEAGADRRYAQRFDIPIRAGQPVVIDKTVAIYTSQDRAIAAPVLGALGELARSPAGVAGLLSGHSAAWARLWDRFRVELNADRDTHLVLNLHQFHLLQTISPHTAELDTGVPARGLHGEGYRGHVFWDELFVLPVITAHLPGVARALLDYRWRRLDAARYAARQAGLAGALFPWQSGSDGREETPSQLFNLRSQRWMPDNSRRQRHVGLAVAYNAWRYYQATGDIAWLGHHGGELIIEVARLFASLADYDPSADRFHICGVMGPDEYHDSYPDAPGVGLRDNAYTNVLAAWACQRAVDTLTTLSGHDCSDLLGRLGVTDDERAQWAHLSRRLAVPLDADGVISQFDGYEGLAELDWGHYRAAYGNIGRLDLILEAEGDSTNRYKLAKQADVLMLIYLLGPDELLHLLAQLGYPVTPEDLMRTVEYYLARTAHGSTLSRVVHASVLARADPARAWATFRDVLGADLDDTQGGTTREGIHLGAMAGSIDIVTRVFAGLQVHADTLTFTPRLPAELHRVGFGLQHRNHCIDVTLDHDRLRLAAHPCAAAPIAVQVDDLRGTVTGGQVQEFNLVPRTGESDRHGRPRSTTR